MKVEGEKMNILVGCEESQAVTIELRKRGHEAYSCDLQPCSGNHPEWHIVGDIFDVEKSSGWDSVISFPPCTDLTVSGARWFEAKRADGRQEASIRFFFDVWKISDAVENPIGILNRPDYVAKWFPDLYDEMIEAGFPFKPSQIIQPWQFGHGETKATCLWLNGLPELSPTDIVSGREQRIWRLPPTEDRAKLRSKTFEGIAKAMADQWFGWAM
jgi:hypothetical protein